MPEPRVILASASPRRHQLLRQIGVESAAIPADIDERRLPHESVESLVSRLAVAKAETVARNLDGAAVVIGSDTAVVIDGEALGKPRSREHAFAMWTQLSGREHEVLTAVALIHDNVTTSALSRSQVRFRTIKKEEMEKYWQSGEPRDKAGGYAIQGIGAIFVETINGSYSGIMGLPLFETAELLASAGIKRLGPVNRP